MSVERIIRKRKDKGIDNKKKNLADFVCRNF